LLIKKEQQFRTPQEAPRACLCAIPKHNSLNTYRIQKRLKQVVKKKKKLLLVFCEKKQKKKNKRKKKKKKKKEWGGGGGGERITTLFPWAVKFLKS